MTDEIRDRMAGFLPRLRRFAYALTRNLDQADDLVQETCARALSRIDQWQAGTSLESWMFRIAQNLWYDRARALKSRGEVVDIDTMHGLVGSDGRSVTEHRLALREVEKGIAQLNEDQQVLISLVCVDGLSYKEAADILQVPMGTVMSRLARARRTLNEILEPALQSSDPELHHD